MMLSMRINENSSMARVMLIEKQFLHSLLSKNGLLDMPPYTMLRMLVFVKAG